MVPELIEQDTRINLSKHLTAHLLRLSCLSSLHSTKN